MIPFAVAIEGVTQENRAVWVLAVTKRELLTTSEDGTLAWYPLAKCRFAKMVSPEAPTPVMVVQPPPHNGGIMLPNRAERRRLDRQ